jgi:hypothetical protein
VLVARTKNVIRGAVVDTSECGAPKWVCSREVGFPRK